MCNMKNMGAYMAAELEEMIVGALSGEEKEIQQLSNRIKSSEVQELRDAQASFDSMLDSWDETIAKNETMAKLCIELAEKDALEGQIFRTALNNAAKYLLPPYISSQTVLKALGARDAEVPASEVASRLKKLQKIKSGCLVYLADSKIWGKVSTIDKGTATLGINSLSAGNLLSLPISSALSAAVFFDANPEMFNILVPDRNHLPASSKFKDVFNRNALTELTEARLKEILTRLIVPECMAIDAFQTWWSEVPQVAVAGKRAPWDARSILELDTLLAPHEASGVKLGAEETAKLATLFGRLRITMTSKDVTMLGNNIARLSISNPMPVLTEMFQPLRGKAPFWPAEVANAQIGKDLEVWGHISIKLLPAFVKASKVVYTEEELAAFGCILPLRCLTTLFEALEQKTVAGTIFSQQKLSADILLYIWKNRTKLPRNLVSIVDMKNVAEAISVEGLPKEWTAAVRDLKRTLFEKADFQKFLIENADGDIPSIIDALQRVRTFQMGECQSLLVKLARHSEELKAHIENEGGKRLMGAGETDSPAAQPDITSQASFTKLTQELEDIVTVQIPENVKAIEHARGFGDFRENAEYDAAKERRRFLHRRRSELENLVATIHTTNFKDIKINDYVVLGSTVTLADASGKTSDYYVLGALDGDPDNNRISYKTKLGEILMAAKVGDTVKLPGIGDRTVKAVAALPEAMRKELAEEA